MRHRVVVHYHEIGLKGRNRGWFEQALVRNIRDALAGMGTTAVRVVRGRLIVDVDGAPGDEVLDRFSRVFGIANYAPAVEIDSDVDAMTAAALDLLAAAPFGSFAIAARRATKELPFTSRDINVAVGAAVQAATGAKVNLDAPDVRVSIEVVGPRTFVYAHGRPGPGGLPVGVSGRVVSLLSGGIDSAVATHRICKRGARAILCHFYSFPFTDKASARKATEIAATVAQWQGNTTLWLVPFGDAQQEIVVSAPPPLRVVLYRRLMMRVAAEVARADGAKAIVTGESLGQVASQTLENLTCIEDAAAIPVLRPLIGDDKQDIISEARRIGTYELALLPGDDCCSLFVPRSPATRATVAQCVAAEAALDMPALVAATFGASEVTRVGR